jgi:hypothetical protein
MRISRSALTCLVFLTALGATPSAARAAPSEEEQSDLLVGAMLSVVGGMVVIGGIYADVQLAGDASISPGFSYTFSGLNLALGGSLLIVGIVRHKPIFIGLGVLPLIVGVIGMVLTPIRQADGVSPTGAPLLRAPPAGGLGFSF